VKRLRNSLNARRLPNCSARSEAQCAATPAGSYLRPLFGQTPTCPGFYSLTTTGLCPVDAEVNWIGSVPLASDTCPFPTECFLAWSPEVSSDNHIEGKAEIVLTTPGSTSVKRAETCKPSTIKTLLLLQRPEPRRNSHIPPLSNSQRDQPMEPGPKTLVCSSNLLDSGNTQRTATASNSIQLIPILAAMLLD